MLTTVADTEVRPAPERGVLATIGDALWRHRWAFATTATLVVIFGVNGVPLDAMALLLFAVTILAIDGLTTKGLAETGRVFKDWGPLFGILLFYDLTHGIAESMGMPLQVEALINADKVMFLGEVPTVVAPGTPPRYGDRVVGGHPHARLLLALLRLAGGSALAVQARPSKVVGLRPPLPHPERLRAGDVHPRPRRAAVVGPTSTARSARSAGSWAGAGASSASSRPAAS